MGAAFNHVCKAYIALLVVPPPPIISAGFLLAGGSIPCILHFCNTASRMPAQSVFSATNSLWSENFPLPGLEKMVLQAPIVLQAGVAASRKGMMSTLKGIVTAQPNTVGSLRSWSGTSRDWDSKSLYLVSWKCYHFADEELRKKESMTNCAILDFGRRYCAATGRRNAIWGSRGGKQSIPHLRQSALWLLFPY